MRKLLFTALLLCTMTTFSVVAATLDSIGLERKNGRIFILHRIEYGETLYAISKKYGVDSKTITDDNANINFTSLQIGQIIRVPHQGATSNSTARTGGTAYTTPVVNTNTNYSVERANVLTTPKNDGKTQIGYMVRMGDNLYNIAKRFKTDLYTLKKLNNLQSNDLQPGQVLLVEIDGPVLGAANNNDAVANRAVAEANNRREVATDAVPDWAYQPAVDESNEMVHLVHTIEEGNTLASIAAQYGISTEKIREMNKMQPNAPLPAIGENLVIGISYIPKDGGSSKVTPTSNTGRYVNNTVTNDNYNYGGNYNAAGNVNTGLPTNRRVVGIGARITGNATIASNKALALHATAREGAYIKVTNPNNGKYTLVKVVGKLSSADAGNSTIIKISQTACQTLGITDDRFQIILEYND